MGCLLDCLLSGSGDGKSIGVLHPDPAPSKHCHLNGIIIVSSITAHTALVELPVSAQYHTA